MKKNPWDEQMDELMKEMKEEEEDQAQAASAWAAVCTLLREQGLVVAQVYEWWQWSWGKKAGEQDYASDKEAVFAALRWKTGKPKIRRETVFALVLLLLCLLGMGYVWQSVAREETCAFDADGCAGKAPQATGACFQQRTEVATQEITEGPMAIGTLTLFYSPLCTGAFAQVVLTHPGTVTDLSVLVEHPSSYTAVFDRSVLPHQQEAWSVFAPVPAAGTMVSASAIIALPGTTTTLLVSTPKTFLASW